MAGLVMFETKYKGFIECPDKKTIEGVAVLFNKAERVLFTNVIRTWRAGIPINELISAEHYDKWVVVAKDWSEIIKFFQLYVIGTEDKKVRKLYKKIRKIIDKGSLSEDTFTLTLQKR